jgi:hypothetical protein
LTERDDDGSIVVMNADELRRRVDAIIERQDEAMIKLEESRPVLGKTGAGLRDQTIGGLIHALHGIGAGLDELRTAIEVQGEVMAILRAGNREALQILRSLPQ